MSWNNRTLVWWYFEKHFSAKLQEHVLHQNMNINCELLIYDKIPRMTITWGLSTSCSPHPKGLLLLLLSKPRIYSFIWYAAHHCHINISAARHKNAKYTQEAAASSATFHKNNEINIYSMPKAAMRSVYWKKMLKTDASVSHPPPSPHPYTIQLPSSSHYIVTPALVIVNG